MNETKVDPFIHCKQWKHLIKISGHCSDDLMSCKMRGTGLITGKISQTLEYKNRDSMAFHSIETTL